MQAESSPLEHPIYKRAENVESADGLAWVFLNKDELTLYPFKYPPLGADQIRAKVLYTGICQSDVGVARQKYGPCAYPICPGHEVIAEVTEVGSGVTTHKVGEIVGYGPMRTACFKCKHCNKGLDNVCNEIPRPEKGLFYKYFGGWATHIQQPASHAFHIPQGMDLTTCPPLLCAGATVFSPMARELTSKDMRVAILGIGGLGHLAVQYGKALGNEVAAFTTTPDKVDYIKSLGASEVIVVDNELKELQKHANKFNVIINTLPVSNPKIFDAYLNTLVPGGSLIQIGAPDKDSGALSCSFFSLVPRELKIKGSAAGSLKETANAIDFAHNNGVKVQAETFSFEDLPKAVERLEKGKPFFRCVVDVKTFNDKHFPAK